MHLKIYILTFLLLFLAAAGDVSAQKKIPESTVAPGWERDGIMIRIKDDLKHPLFSWPLTRMEYQLNFGENGTSTDAFNLVNAEGKSIPFQLIRTELKNNRVKQTTLTFSTGLQSGEDKLFRLVSGKTAMAKGTGAVSVLINGEFISISNGQVRFEIPSAKNSQKGAPPILRFGNNGTWLGHGEMPLNLPVVNRTVTEINNGPVLAEYRIKYGFEGGKSYRVDIRLAESMEFIELEEAMTGFTPNDSVSWRFVWDGLQPDSRYFATRSDSIKDRKEKGYANITWEPMEGFKGDPKTEKHPFLDYDQQNREDGRLPFRIATYDNWMSWWRLPTAAFWSEKQNITIGFFVKDMENWNDGEYPIWGSKDNLGIYFHWKNKVLDYTFPFVTGSRSFALTAYDHQKDINLIDSTNIPLAYVDFLRRWYGWVPLDKVQTWVLDYDKPKGSYPKYFKPGNTPPGTSLSNLETTLSGTLRSIATGSERNRGPSPVGTRVFHDNIAPSFDLNASKMTDEQFRRLRAWFLFNNYVFMDETLMPIRTMISGHPNFLADIKGVQALTAFLFPDHPQVRETADHFEKFVQLNYRYHVRPEVQAWQSLGGRWTENLATYTWAALKPTLRPSYLLHHYFDGRNRILQPGISPYSNWLLNALTAPLQLANNHRVYPPQGAHSRSHGGGPPSMFRMLAQELMYYDPLLAEGMLYVSSAQDRPFESTAERDKPWSEMLKGEWQNNKGTNPHLRSAKFTGYGFVLRSGFGKEDEMYVSLQQIDEGPNYRWGRAGMGGNGVIYYYAHGKRYSHNGAEDVGDGPFGDVERSTNFGVKKAAGYRGLGPYRSVGKNDLTEPLFDFGFAQMATVKANSVASPDYRSRSVMQSGSDYIAVFDDVADNSIEGRLSWFVGIEDDFPAIHQVVPGAGFVESKIPPSQSNYHKDPEVMPTKGRYYDGRGDFLTVVTHKAAIKVLKTDYGCVVTKEGNLVDNVFRSSNEIEYKQGGSRFKGTAGIIQQLSNKDEYAASLFAGTIIATRGLEISLAENNKAGIGFQTMTGGFYGKVQSPQQELVTFSLTGKRHGTYRFYLDGQLAKEESAGFNHFTIPIPSGNHTWQLTSNGVIPRASQVIAAVTSSKSALVSWQAVPGADHYRVQLSKDGGETWVDVHTAKEANYTLTALENNTKVHVRIIAMGAGGAGAPSNEYPIYVTDQVPHAPEGLRVDPNGPGISITWGTILGSKQYHLYRRERKPHDKSFTGEYKRIFSGFARQFQDKKPASSIIYEYVVTAENGNGESLRSVASDTDPARFLNWDPMPGEAFRRDTEDHENGFKEFNPFVEDTMPILEYPASGKKIKSK